MRSNILLIQQGYIDAIAKVNTAIGITKFPDFLLVTHDSYIDVLEIKKPTTNLVKEDGSRGNYFFDTEISRAVIQTENYLEQVGNNGDALRRFLKDNHNLDIRVIRPRGIILAGSSAQLSTPKERDDVRLLSLGHKNLTVITYDELLSRLRNYIAVLEKASAHNSAPAGSPRTVRGSRRAKRRAKS